MHMMEPLFGTSPPLWNAMPPASSAWPSSPLAGGARPGNGGAQFPAPSQIRMSAEAIGAGSAVPMTGNVGLPALYGAVEIVAPTAALLTAVAMRRGQPAGPGTDAEIEDFLNDALDLIPGTVDVEVRCEGGRVMLSGNVPHKRHKRDVGEIAWALPMVNDVTNNVAIVARRKARASMPTREAESQAGPIRKHG